MNNRHRDMVITALEHVDDRYDDRQRKLLGGALLILKGDRDAETAYIKAIINGAKQVTLPSSVENTAAYYIHCCPTRRLSGMDYTESDRVELTMYEWTVYTCPRCGKVWALRIEQPEGDEDDITS